MVLILTPPRTQPESEHPEEARTEEKYRRRQGHRVAVGGNDHVLVAVDDPGKIEG